MSRVRPVRQSESQPDVPALRSLGPAYEENLHGRHASVLLKVLTDRSANAATNIALAGHYGSGKSSVIRGVQTGLDSRKINWVNLSLSSLGIDDTKRARIQQDGTLPPLTNLIQKEIVKQLLYRKAPADMPGSRYFRIDSFRPWPAATWSAVVAVGFFVIAVLLGLVDRAAKMGPQALITGRDWLPWIIVGGLGVFLGVIWFLGLRALQSRVRVESVSAGGAAVKLSAKENSYFDEYLDEIVYFFQKTKSEVAIFEDLDRFRDPHIFETLRELNTVLNNSEQIKSRPVRFVYAVRDSIFEQLKVDAAPSGEANTDTDATALRASALESAPAANRTKFFDLVVPMVPFITHRSARDLLAAEFADSDEQPSTALMNLVGAHLTDMRLIRNIRNEFEVYRASILGKNGLKGLTPDRLFAMMVYKNLHLEDFEAIRLGTSKIDEAHRAFRDMVAYETGRQVAVRKEALDRIASDDLWDKHAKTLGRRLQEVLPIVYREARRGGKPVLQYQSQHYALSDLTSGDLWRSLHETRQDVQFATPGYVGVKLSFDDVIVLVGDGAAALDDAVEADVARLQRVARAALETKDFVAKATMAQLMARPDLVMPTDSGVERSLDAIVADLVSPLAHDLLTKGHIDENFTLYCSDYHGIAISVSAMNFILHCVQPDRADHRFRFDEAASIDAVEKEMGARFLDGESVFNLQVFDHYLPTHPRQLDKALDKLVMRAGTDASFIDAYLTDGASRESFVSQLAPRWEGMFVHLVENAPIDLLAAILLVDIAVRSADPGIDYDSSDRVAGFLSEHCARMQAFVGTAETSQAADLAILLRRLSSQVSDLAVLGDAQRRAVVTDSLYPVTRANLAAALGEGTQLALDVVKAANATVYQHILDNLDSYLHAREDVDVTVYASEEFVAVLNDIAGVAPLALLPVAKGASEACEVADLEELDRTAWTSVVSAGRVKPTVWNVSQFVSEFGVSEELRKALNSLDLTQADEVEEESRYDLGYALVHAEDLDPAARVRLVKQLELPGGLDPERLSGAGVKLLPALLAAELVPDAAETYALVSGSPFAVREEYFAVSRSLASYVCELPLSSDDLPKMMRSRRVAPAVKRAIAADAEYVHSRLSRHGAIVICEWAAMGNTVSVDLLVKLSEAGAPAGHILKLLEPHFPDIELPVLDEILQTLGDEYEPLTRLGRHRPKLKARDGTEELLDELKRRGRVSSFNRTLLGGIQVNMRH
ncbi:YobI family P-loop NTPase [Micromonospora aurantiaca (nom. illeg.)]